MCVVACEFSSRFNFFRTFLLVIDTKSHFQNHFFELVSQRIDIEINFLHPKVHNFVTFVSSLTQTDFKLDVLERVMVDFVIST